MERQPATYISPYITENGEVPPYLEAAEKLWRKKFEAALALGITNPNYLFIPDAVRAYLLAQASPDSTVRHLATRYSYQSAITFSNDADPRQIVVEAPDGTKSVRWVAVAALLGSQAPQGSLQQTEPPLTTPPVASVLEEAQTQSRLQQPPPDQALTMLIEPLTELEKVHPEDFKHLQLILTAISDALQEKDRKIDPLSQNYKDLAEYALTPNIYCIFKQLAEIKIPISQIRKFISEIYTNNSRDYFAVLLEQLLNRSELLKQVKINNYAVPEIPTITQDTPQLVAKIWYFLINQPKIKLDTRCQMPQNNRAVKHDRYLVARWHHLVQLPPQEFVVLFLQSLGAKDILIDTLLHMRPGTSKQLLESFFEQQAASTTVHDAKILGMAGLAATFHNVLNFNPLARLESSLANTKEKLPREEWEEITLACERLLAAANRNSALGLTGINKTLRERVNGLCFSPSWVKIKLTTHFPVRPADDLVNIADVIWLTRALRNYRRKTE